MIRIEYILDPQFFEEADRANLASRKTDILYHYFWGCASLQFSDVNVELPGCPLPVLYFADLLWHTLNGLRDGETRSLDVPEGSDLMSFTRFEDLVVVVTSWSSDRATVPYGEFVRAAQGFLRQLMGAIEARWPKVSAHREFRRLSGPIR